MFPVVKKQNKAIMLYPKEHRVWDGQLENISEWFQTGFRPFWGGSYELRALSGKNNEFKYDRFGNQKFQGELGERKPQRKIC